MKRRKYRKYALKDNTVFEPIVYDKLSFNLRNELDLFATTVELDDYDWMSYKLKAWLPTKAYGDIVIDFVYNGTSPCTMIIETKKKKYRFYFAIELFQEHIINYTRRSIETDGSQEAKGYATRIISEKNVKKK